MTRPEYQVFGRIGKHGGPSFVVDFWKPHAHIACAAFSVISHPASIHAVHEPWSEQKHGYMLFLSFVPATGGLLFGCDWVVTGGAKSFHRKRSTI